MIKNYVVWTNCQVNETETRFNIEPCADATTRSAYDTMFRISYASAKKFLQGNWEPIVFTDTAASRVDMFKDNWQKIWNIWHGELCNILYLDSDTMFIRPTEIFGRFQEFRLFNWTDPKSNEQFKDYYNAGVRYYPASMSNETWNIGKNMSDKWSLDIWDQEQLIFNEMFWQQAIPENDRRHPELNWQGMWLTIPDPNVQAVQEQWNQLAIKDTHIIHVHGSRGAVKTMALMTQACQSLVIDY
jgi:hypothetical protein